jgi:hypothetical protein
MRGFLFEHSRSDASSPQGVRRTRIAAIAATRRDALDLAGDILPAIAMRLVDEGHDAMQLARAAGVGDGEAKVIG